MSHKPLVLVAPMGLRADFNENPDDRPTERTLRSLPIDHVVLLHDRIHWAKGKRLVENLAAVRPNVTFQRIELDSFDAWLFEETFDRLAAFAATYPFDTVRADYVFLLTTGSYVIQCCTFALNEARAYPGDLILANPAHMAQGVQRIDLRERAYAPLHRRFEVVARSAEEALKNGILTRSPTYNALIDEILTVALRTTRPVLILGPTGAGKSALAERLHRARGLAGIVEGPLVDVNCATLRGTMAMAELFGHVKGAFTGATEAREGFLGAANGGTLFLDEVGELGLEEQAMLLRCLDKGVYYPVGTSKTKTARFHLVCGTNRNLGQDVAQGRFRADLYERLNCWTYTLPALKDRREDIAPNFEHELQRASVELGRRVECEREASAEFLRFAESDEALWTGNFRDLGNAVIRMATLAPTGCITTDLVHHEVARLRSRWAGVVSGPAAVVGADPVAGRVAALLAKANGAALCRFDRVQLQGVLEVCCRSAYNTDAARQLYDLPGQPATTSPHARLSKFLERHGLSPRDFWA